MSGHERAPWWSLKSKPEPAPAAPAPEEAPEPAGDWWNRLYDEDDADTFTGAPASAAPAPPVVPAPPADPPVYEADAEYHDGEPGFESTEPEPEFEHGTTKTEKPKKAQRKKKRRTTDAVDGAEEDPDTAAERAMAYLKAVRRLENLSVRRWLAAKYTVGAALGSAFGIPQYIRGFLHFTYAHPGQGLSSALFFVFLGASLVTCAKIARTRPVNWLAALVGSLFTASAASGFGYILADEATARGIPVHLTAPLAVGAGIALTSWWVIDTRTARWVEHWPGRCLHWGCCALTGSAALALATYLPNAL